MTFGAYKLEGRLGSNAVAEIHAAVHRAPDGHLTPVRLLRVHPGFWGDPVFGGELQERLRAIAALELSSLVPVFEVGAHAKQPFVAYERVEGSTLRELLEARPGQRWEAGLVAHVGVEIAAALKAAHALAPSPLLHASLSPEAVFVAEDGSIKITDFGLAGVLESSVLTHPRKMSPESAAYSAPEQLRKRRPGPQTDIFALGALLYELSAGQPAFTGRNALEVSERVLAAEHAPLDERAPDAGKELVALIHRMLAPEPYDRVASIGEVLAVLSELAPKEGAEERLASLLQASVERPPESRGEGPGAAEHRATSLDKPSFAQVQEWVSDAKAQVTEREEGEAEQAVTSLRRPAYRGEAASPPSALPAGAFKKTDVAVHAFEVMPPTVGGELPVDPAEGQPSFLLLGLGLGLLAVFGLALGVLVIALLV